VVAQSGRGGGNSSTRNHQTLTSVIESFLSNDRQGSGEGDHADDLRTNLINALGVMETEQGSELANQLLESLDHQSGSDSKGVPPDFFDTLDRVDVKTLAPTDDCPICTNVFHDDKYPLVVRLPCSMKHAKDHIFDLDCIAPWLSVNSTCPLCRFDVKEINRLRRERLEADLKAAEDSEEEEDDDRDLYG
jgi:hypothetical protein